MAHAQAEGRQEIELMTYASRAACPFFRARGYEVVETCHPVRHGVELTNYRMVRRLNLG